MKLLTYEQLCKKVIKEYARNCSKIDQELGKYVCKKKGGKSLQVTRPYSELEKFKELLKIVYNKGCQEIGRKFFNKGSNQPARKAYNKIVQNFGRSYAKK